MTDANASYKKLAMQDMYHGQPHGMFAADECFGGRNLNRGIELCAVVEQMYVLPVHCLWSQFVAAGHHYSLLATAE